MPFRLLALLCLVLLPLAAEESVRSLVRKAKKAEKAGRLSEAIVLYQKAAAREPANKLYPTEVRRLIDKAMATSVKDDHTGPEPAPAAPAPPPAAKLPPELAPAPLPAGDAISDEDLREARRLLPPPELRPKIGPFDFDLRAQPREVIRLVTTQLGLETIYDLDLPESGQPLHFAVSGATALEALDALAAATGTFFVPMAPNRLLAAKDTTQKRQELEPTVAVVLSLPDPVAIQELQELARAVQQTMELKKFAIDNVRRMVLLRDRISQVRPAQHVFEQLLGARPVVSLEVDIIELRSSRTLNYGVGLPNSTTLFNLNRLWIGQPVTPASGSQVGTFGGGSTLIGLTLTDAEVTANLLKTSGFNRQHAEIRTVHGQKAEFLVGERYPIMTSTYIGDTTSTDGTTYRPPPTVQFENLGLTLKATPYVHASEEMTIDIEAEYKVLSGAELNGIPILVNRKFDAHVRLRNDEWAVLAGLDTGSNARTDSGIAGLQQIPYIGALFRQRSSQLDSGEMIVLLKPRLLSLPATETVTSEIRLGSESRPRLLF